MNSIRDPDSPPAKFSELIGLTGLIKSFTDEIAKPSHEKLLPDWSQVGFFVSKDDRTERKNYSSVYSPIFCLDLHYLFVSLSADAQRSA